MVHAVRRRTHGHATPSPTAGGQGSGRLRVRLQPAPGSFRLRLRADRGLLGCALHSQALHRAVCAETREVASGDTTGVGRECYTVRDRVCRDSAHDCRGPCGAGSGGRCRASRRERAGSGHAHRDGCRVVSCEVRVASRRRVASALAALWCCGLCVVSK